MIDWNTRPVSNMDTDLLTPDNEADTSDFERAIITRPRPSLLINERELSVLRRGLTKDGWKRTLYLQPIGQCSSIYTGAGLLSLANKWLDTKVERPDWHSERDMLCCRHSGQLAVPTHGSQCCGDCTCSLQAKALSVPLCRAQSHRLASGALALALVYGIERDKAYAQKAAEILVAMTEACADTPQTTPTILDPRWVVPMTQVYDLICCSRCLGEEDKEQIAVQFLTEAARQFTTADNTGAEGAWRLSALGIIGLALKNHQVVRQSINGLNVWLEQLGDDGLVRGSLSDDHFDSLSALVHMAEAFHRCGLDIYRLEPAPGKSIRAMFVAPIKHAYPSFQLPAIGDSSYDSFLPIDLYEVAYRRWPDPELAWVLKKGHGFAKSRLNENDPEHVRRYGRASFYAFVFGRDLPGRSPGLSPRSGAVSSQGVCCLKNSTEVMATVVCGSLKESRHLDKLSFTLYADNEVLVPDYGTPASGETCEWFGETWAHNTVVVDGQSQALAHDWAQTTHYLGDEFQGAQFISEECYPGVTHKRTIILLGQICIVADSLQSEDKHSYDWLMRCEGTPQLLGTHPAVSHKSTPHPMIAKTSSCEIECAATLVWKCPNGPVNQTIWAGPGSTELTLATCPADTLHRRVPLVICRQYGREAEFASAFVPVYSGKDCKVSRDGRLLIVSREDRVDYIYSSALGDDDCEAISTDARFAAVRTRRGAVESMAIADGSRLEWNGQLMMKCPAPVECVEATFDSHGPQIRYIGGSTGSLLLKTSARAARVNGHRAATSNTGGIARLGITPQMTSRDSSRT